MARGMAAARMAYLQVIKAQGLETKPILVVVELL